jgi:GT2 family glycosyltransferase
MYQGKTVGLAISNYCYSAKALETFKTCILSLVPRMKYIDRLYIVDDCSPFTPVHQYYKYLLPGQFKVVKNHVNRGIAGVKNLSMRLLADCDYMILCDNDITFKQGWDDFYLGNMLKSEIPAVSLSNVFNDVHPVKTVSMNGANVDHFTKFQGCFMITTKEAYAKVGGMPLLPSKYGQEHYNWQIRLSREYGWGDCVLDFSGGNKFITTLPHPNTFITGPEKYAQSEKNAVASKKILREGTTYMPNHIEADPKKRGDNICICIGHRNSTPDRLSNTLSVVDYYKSVCPEADIIVVEQDTSPALQPHLRKDVRYVLAHNKGSYNRSWAFNIGAKMTDRPVIACMDNDVIIKPHTIFHAADEKIMSGEFDVYRPYWKFLDLDARRTNDFKQAFRFGWKDSELPSRCGHLEWMMGGCSFAKRDKFLEIGGFNEKFRGWGGEDDEFGSRARKLLRVGKVVQGDLYDFNLYHLYHSRTIDCTQDQSGYQANVAELRRVEAMAVEELRDYVRNNLAGQGDLEKYRSE